jgi:mRNA-degrading endonuclease RelE of RelBE toxin-antitoxin system
MDFRIADTFTDSLARLTGTEQKAVKTTAFDLQLDPSAPSMSFHRLDRARDPNFWSVRVNADIRLIVHRTATSLLLCYVGHHDAAYGWAERRKIERHPTTGAAQFVEIRERVEEIAAPRPAAAAPAEMAKPPLFADVPDGMFLAYGVPPEWIGEVRRATAMSPALGARPASGVNSARSRGRSSSGCGPVSPSGGWSPGPTCSAA